MEWKRMTSLNLNKSKCETWQYENETENKQYDVEIIAGKPLDVIKLKKQNRSNYKNDINKLRSSRKNIYKQTTDLTECPICGDSVTNSGEILKVYGAVYVKCQKCSHCFVVNPPTKEALEEFYSNNYQYQSTYADKKNLEDRVHEIAIPKLKFLLAMYQKEFGRKPKSVLDVGAGSGHFVHACRQAGLRADGIEISKTGIEFCKNNFNIDLFSLDFNDSYQLFSGYDIITFWGVIEHVSFPLKMLNSARKIAKENNTMIAVEVPRWFSFSTTIQSLRPEDIMRHLDPLGHIHMFTDESLATAFVKTGFNIKAAWYFGMDVYELFSQLMLVSEDENFIEKIDGFINPLQVCIDSARLSDEVVLIGIPEKNK